MTVENNEQFEGENYTVKIRKYPGGSWDASIEGTASGNQYISTVQSKPNSPKTNYDYNAALNEFESEIESEIKERDDSLNGEND